MDGSMNGGHGPRPVAGRLARRSWIAGIAAVAAAGLPALAPAAEPLRIAVVAELSGSGSAAGASFQRGVELAVRHVNEEGGVLGRPLQATVADTRSDPATAAVQVQQAVKDEHFAVFGPVYSASVLSSMAHTRGPEVPHFIGGEAMAITRQGHPSVFRTSFTQAIAMPKLAVYLAERTTLRRVALIYVDNEFGRGGYDALKLAMSTGRAELALAVPTKQGQANFAQAVSEVKASGADAVIVYCHEEESAHALRELRKQGWRKPVYGESTLVSQKVIDLAGPAAEGVIAHVGLTADAPIPAIQRFRERYRLAFQVEPDHNSMKGYAGVHVMKIALERAGSIDRAALVQAMKGLRVNAARYPGALMYTEYDRKGDLDRMSFLMEVRQDRQAVVDYLPPLANGAAQRLPTPNAPLSPPSPLKTSEANTLLALNALND
jgi:branched-chain amino acid transport system substrate-binding protein